MTTDNKLAEALRTFTAWFTANYPGPDTIICHPNWHAPRIFRAARYALMLDDETAQPAAQAEPVAWRCTWARTNWSQYHDETEPLPTKWDDDPPDQILPLYAHPPAQPAAPAQDARDAARVCGWTEDEDGNWDTGCGHLFVLNDGTPSDNEMGFCCFCGNKLEQETLADAAMAREAQP